MLVSLRISINWPQILFLTSTWQISKSTSQTFYCTCNLAGRPLDTFHIPSHAVYVTFGWHDNELKKNKAVGVEKTSFVERFHAIERAEVLGRSWFRWGAWLHTFSFLFQFFMFMLRFLVFLVFQAFPTRFFNSFISLHIPNHLFFHLEFCVHFVFQTWYGRLDECTAEKERARLPHPLASRYGTQK